MRRMAGFVCTAALALAAAAGTLEQDFAEPPRDARLRAYWWWLNGNVTREAITRDLEEMKAKGFGGALICDADGSAQGGHARAPHGPTFFSPEWRELYRHALREAGRLGLEMSLNIQSGWNLGGPMVSPEDAPKKLVWTETRVKGGTAFDGALAQPKGRDGFYRDLFVLAWRETKEGAAGHRPLRNQPQKALIKPLVPFSAPDSGPLFEEFPAREGEEDTRAGDVLDLTAKLRGDGTLDWAPPEGDWAVLRIGCTLNDHCRVSTCSEGWEGYALDPFDGGAFRQYWDAVVEPLIADAGPLAGTALKYLHTDSWEVEVANWTPTLREAFRARRGYDLLPWLPVVAGKIVDGRDASNRFLHDFRRTLGDLAIANHYRPFKERAHARGLLIHPESGGPHAVPVDAQQCLGFNDAPMSEFWAWSWRHRMGDGNRFFVKQPASAAHTYGRKLVLAEGFTTIGPHWQEMLWDNLKPAFDKALCEGLNLLVWHAFVCSPKEQGLPGQQYFAGTHLNPNVTWWAYSEPFFAYINRCQALLQRGRPFADVLYYYGDHVPNFAQHKRTDPAKILPGYDYDVATEEALLTRVSVRGGRFVLPDGVSYRVLALPGREVISLRVLRKVREWVAAGAAVVGPVRPKRASGLDVAARADAGVERLAEELWGGGKVVSGMTARDALAAQGVAPDCVFDVPAELAEAFDFIHRTDGDDDIYFVANRSTNAVAARCSFRVKGKLPELWDAVSGTHGAAAGWSEENGIVTVPVDFAPCGSRFVVFRGGGTASPAPVPDLRPLISVAALTGPWRVAFDPEWGGPEKPAVFETLEDWTQRAEPGIKYYSGTAVYRKTVELEDPRGARLWLDLGRVRELAEVRVNGKPCGVVWTPPFRVEITDAAKPGTNEVEIRVVNFWYNRVSGDKDLPAEKRLTRTNIRKLENPGSPLMPSGLFGPVNIVTFPRGQARS